MKSQIVLSILLLCGLWHSMLADAKELPDNSIYHVDSAWVNQQNTPLKIGDLAGKVQVVAFIYTYCEHSCPIIMSKLKRIESLLTTEQKKQLQFLLVSLDPERDTPEALDNYMLKHKLDRNHWLMLNGDPDDVLELSALVGVRYKPMDNEGKDIAHSNMITVLDKDGQIHHQMKGLGESTEQVVEAIGVAVLVDD